MTTTRTVPHYDHIVIVAEENHGYNAIVGNSNAPYINGTLIKDGALLTNDHDNGHPSLPNYLAMYGGSTFGVTDDNTHHESDPSLYTVLHDAGYSFTGYVDDAGGLTDYDHNPWESFPEGTSVEKDWNSSQQTWGALLGGNYNNLPTVSFITPNLNNDMHDGTVAQGDTWLKNNLDAYRQWAETHNSLLIVTWDESETDEHIATVLDGAGITPGTTDGTNYSHYNLLSTVLAAKGLTGPRNAATASTYDVFQAGTTGGGGTLSAHTDITTATQNVAIPAGTDVATFTDSVADPTSDYSADINWNTDQGTITTAGTIVADGGGTFTVDGGPHTYQLAGTRPISVTVKDSLDNQTIVANGTVTVAAGTGGSTGGGTTSPQTALHYAPNGSVSGAESLGFNVNDVSSVTAANALPAGDKGLVWWGNTSGVTSAFKSLVAAAEASSKVYGIYIADEPGNSASTIANIKAEVQYINANAPDKIAFIVADNFGTPTNPSMGGYTPSATGMTQSNDLIGLDPYPVRPEFSGGINLSVIDDGVNAAEKAGWSASHIVPVYQAFGDGTNWTLPTGTQEHEIMQEWVKAGITAPAFDYGYTYGLQSGLTGSISTSSALQSVFAAHNSGQF
jgi:hypothetical protein